MSWPLPIRSAVSTDFFGQGDLAIDPQTRPTRTPRLLEQLPMLTLSIDEQR